MVGEVPKGIGNRRRDVRLLGALALALAAAGCVRYEAVVRIAPAGEVRVSEKLAIDREWREEVRDTLDASRQVIDRYVREARGRGGVVQQFGTDSAAAEFRYASLPAFVRAWPDSSDEGQAFDRSVHHRLREGGAALEELILFRMSPPDPRQKRDGQRQPVVRIAVIPPARPVRHNAHRVSGETYWWQFTDAMQKPDSVHIVWPAASAP